MNTLAFTADKLLMQCFCQFILMNIFILTTTNHMQEKEPQMANKNNLNTRIQDSCAVFASCMSLALVKYKLGMLLIANENQDKKCLMSVTIILYSKA